MSTHSTTAAAPAAGQVAEDSQEAAWTSWPAIERPAKTAALLAGLVASSIAAGLLIGSVGSGFLALVLLTVCLANYLLPIRYRLTDDGLVVRGIGEPSLIKWSRIDAARMRNDHAVLLVTPDGQSTSREFVVRFPEEAANAAEPLKQRLLNAGAPLV